MPLGTDLIQQPHTWQLLMEVGPTALAVVAFSPMEHHSMLYESIPYDEAAPTPLRRLEDAVYDNPLLLADFARITVLYDTPRFLPLPLMPEDDAVAMFRRVFPTDTSLPPSRVLVTDIETMNLTIAFEIPTDILGFIRRTFPSVHIEHHLAPLCRYFKVKHSGRPHGKTLVNLRGNRLDIVTLGHEAPLMVNSFRFDTPLDAAYYILSARQRLSLPPTDEIMIAGDRATRAAITPTLRRYARYVMPAIFPSAMFRAGRASLSAPFELIVAPLIPTLPPTRKSN